MSAPEPSESAARTSEDPLGPLHRKDGDPIFDESWQDLALAMADELVRAGVVEAADWAQTLGPALRYLHDAGATKTYYRDVLAALERLLCEGGAVPSRDLSARRDTWKRA
ncbi:MAG: nitrile hydratase subunit beta [Alphaproteobacteria bacterium]|nr:nitrile hydratase subunit beta [Alphaproteobacteria bacterium]